MNPITIRLPLAAALLTAALGLAAPAARADTRASDASALSMVPVAAPAMLLSAGAALTVVAVETASDGAVWLLERASDGARASVRLSARAAGGLSVAVGTAVVVTAVSTGWLLSAAGQVVAFVPNTIGSALLHNERVSR